MSRITAATFTPLHSRASSSLLHLQYHLASRPPRFEIGERRRQLIEGEFAVDHRLDRAAIGPLIRQHSYEVGGEFVERFVQADAENSLFFIPSAREGHAMFDLAGFIRTRLENAGVLMIDDIGVDTYSDERFYSYRRSVHRNEPDYGRHVHAIALTSE